MYELLLQENTENRLITLNTVIVAGESCPPSLALLHYQKLPDTTLYNEYGPTEASVWCSVYKVKPNDYQQTIPIGQAIANTKLYILNNSYQQVSKGEPGELYVAGPGVATGYLNRPELSKMSFISNPFDTAPYNTLYKTGDLVRERTDGLIEFLGRVDQQVKIRGHRVELNEIREHLKKLPQIIDAAVVFQEAITSDLSQYDEQSLIKSLLHLDPHKVEELLQIVESLEKTKPNHLNP